MVVPTCVDERAYAKAQPPAAEGLTFCWIGSPATEHYLLTIEPELEQLCQTLPASLRMIGAAPNGRNFFTAIRRPWSEESEIDEISACQIGVAPLLGSSWDRGKCGLKAIQYMAAGLPVLAAKIGVLPSIVVHGETGFVYADGVEFATFARRLAEDSELRNEMGIAGRERVANNYSMRRWALTICDVLVAAAKRRR